MNGLSKYLLLLNVLLLVACVPEAYVKNPSLGVEAAEEVSVSYDLDGAIKYDSENAGYRGCYLDPASRGFSDSTSYTFYQEGVEIYVDMLVQRWTTTTCSFSGQFPTTLFSGYYKVLSSTLIGTLTEGDHIKLILQSMDYDYDLDMWVESASAPEERQMVINRTTGSIFVENNSPGSYSLELLLNL